MRFKDFFYLQEAISLSNAKKLKLSRKNSGAYTKEVLNDAFNGKDRLIFPISIGGKESVDNSEVFNTVQMVLQRNLKINHQLTDGEYLSGTFEHNKNKYRIGRLLEKYKNESYGPANISDLLDAFKKDPVRVNKSGKFYIVISRHPYDVAGSSTDRSWTSCMDLGFEHIQYKDKEDKGRPGSNSRYVYSDISEGTIAAYVVPSDEILPNGKVKLHRPLSRILIKPHPYEGGIGFSVGKMYGNQYEKFEDFVKNWIQTNLNSKNLQKIERNSQLYKDSDSPVGFEFHNDDVDNDQRNNPIYRELYNLSHNMMNRIMKEEDDYLDINFVVDLNPVAHVDFMFERVFIYDHIPKFFGSMNYYDVMVEKDSPGFSGVIYKYFKKKYNLSITEIDVSKYETTVSIKFRESALDENGINNIENKMYKFIKDSDTIIRKDIEDIMESLVPNRWKTE